MANLLNWIDKGITWGYDNFVLSPKEVQQRETAKEHLALVKKIAVVVAVAAAFFVIIFPKLITLILAGVVAFAAHEVYQGANNLLEISNSVIKERQALQSKEAAISLISKNTFVLAHILRMMPV